MKFWKKHMSKIFPKEDKFWYFTQVKPTIKKKLLGK